MKKLYVLILAAGSGKRLGADIPKAFIKICGKPLLWYPAAIFNKIDYVDKIFFVISESDNDLFYQLKFPYFKNLLKLRGVIHGGAERQNSVYKALDYLKNDKECEYVAIHDAARPIVMPEVIKEAWDWALKCDASAPGIPIVDTVKKVNALNVIDEHLVRDYLTAIQTPQIFKYDKIYRSYCKVMADNAKVTDDTEAYSYLFDNVKIVKGSKDLFKITYKEDLKLAKSLIIKYKKLWN